MSGSDYDAAFDAAVRALNYKSNSYLAGLLLGVGYHREFTDSSPARQALAVLERVGLVTDRDDRPRPFCARDVLTIACFRVDPCFEAWVALKYGDAVGGFE